MADLEFARLHPNQGVDKRSIGCETWTEAEGFRINEVFEEIKV
jgi:hypothetical protein